MVRALILAAVLALSACATQPQATVRASAQGSVSGFATAALWGTWEVELAPAYTRLAALRHRAARALEAGRITVGTAEAIQASADLARSFLDASRRGHSTEPTPQQRTQLGAALGAIEHAEHLLEQ